MAIVVAGLARVGADAAFPDQVKVEGGAVKGAVADGVLSFKGIPFAAPPVGDLRWRPPQPVVPWTGVKDGHGVRPRLRAEAVRRATPRRSGPSRAEDCLVLNVWRPAEKTSAALPVMVWIYGGGFVNGGSSPAVYDGSQFAKHGVVLVSFNYRARPLRLLRASGAERGGTRASRSATTRFMDADRRAEVGAEQHRRASAATRRTSRCSANPPAACRCTCC